MKKNHELLFLLTLIFIIVITSQNVLGAACDCYNSPNQYPDPNCAIYGKYFCFSAGTGCNVAPGPSGDYDSLCAPCPTEGSVSPIPGPGCSVCGDALVDSLGHCCVNDFYWDPYQNICVESASCFVLGASGAGDNYCSAKDSSKPKCCGSAWNGQCEQCCANSDCASGKPKCCGSSGSYHCEECCGDPDCVSNPIQIDCDDTLAIGSWHCIPEFPTVLAGISAVVIVVLGGVFIPKINHKNRK